MGPLPPLETTQLGRTLECGHGISKPGWAMSTEPGQRSQKGPLSSSEDSLLGWDVGVRLLRRKARTDRPAGQPWV